MTNAGVEALILASNSTRPQVPIQSVPHVLSSPAPVRHEVAQSAPLRVKQALVTKLQRDPEGLVLLAQLELGTGLQPSHEIKVRLRHEFGLYPESWWEPFGSQYLDGVETVGIFMIANGPDPDPPRRSGKPNPFVTNLMSRLPMPKFSGHESD